MSVRADEENDVEDRVGEKPVAFVECSERPLGCPSLRHVGREAQHCLGRAPGNEHRDHLDRQDLPVAMTLLGVEHHRFTLHDPLGVNPGALSAGGRVEKTDDRAPDELVVRVAVDFRCPGVRVHDPQRRVLVEWVKQKHGRRHALGERAEHGLALNELRPRQVVGRRLELDPERDGGGVRRGEEQTGRSPHAARAGKLAIEDRASIGCGSDVKSRLVRGEDRADWPSQQSAPVDAEPSEDRRARVKNSSPAIKDDDPIRRQRDKSAGDRIESCPVQTSHVREIIMDQPSDGSDPGREVQVRNSAYVDRIARINSDKFTNDFS